MLVTFFETGRVRESGLGGWALLPSTHTSFRLIKVESLGLDTSWADVERDTRHSWMLGIRLPVTRDTLKRTQVRVIRDIAAISSSDNISHLLCSYRWREPIPPIFPFPRERREW